MSINNRVFGSDIPIKVKKTLEARQLAAEQPRQPNEQIETNYPDYDVDGKEINYNFGDFVQNNFNGEADLSSRTPFIRMWTAVQFGFEEEGDNEEITMHEGELVKIGDDDNKLSVEEKIKLQEEENKAQAHTDQVTTKFPKSYMVWVKDSQDDTKGRYVVRRPTEEFAFSAPKIYMLGNHVLNTTDQITPQQQIVTDENGTATEKYNSLSAEEQQDYVSGQMFPNEHGVPNDVNKFLKPAAGIVSLNTNTEGTMGERKTTTVSFKVHNFADYDQIYNKYFLRPGAQIFIDFGWDTADLYDPYDLMNNFVEDIQDKLYGEKETNTNLQEDGFVTRSKGNLEVLIGQVTDYDSKILENGSVECSLTIMSANVAMMTFPKLAQLKTKIDFLLDHFFQFEALYNFGQEVGEDGNVKNKPDSNLIPDQGTSVRDITEFQENIFSKASKTFGTPDHNPSVLASLSGIFVANNDMDGDSQYTSIGFLEDKILNAEFAFGKNIDDINNVETKGLVTKIDSSESFATYNDSFHEKQSIIGGSGESDPSFVIPRFWDKTYNTITGHSPRGLNNTNFKHYPKEMFTSSEVTNFDSTFDNWISGEGKSEKNKYPGNPFYYDFYPHGAPFTDKDRDLERIPVREIFVHNQVIKDAFGDKSKSFKDVVNNILNAVNEDSDGVLNLKLAGGQENTLKIIDENFLNVSNTTVQSNDMFNKLFKFSIMSPNSIIKSYDVSLSMPNDAIGANIAIQSLSGTNKQVLPISDDFMKSVSLSEIYNTITENLDEDLEVTKKSFRIKYLPDMGDYRGDNLANSHGEKISYQDMYSTFITEENDLYLDVSYSNIVDTSTIFSPIEEEEDPDKEKPVDTEREKNKRNKVIDANDAVMTRNGYFVTQNFTDYFRAKIAGNVLMKKNPPLPLTLSITTYGISSLVPGDIFRVDYLPKMYLDTTYFQVIKVSHEVSPGGWYTTLETQVRYRKQKSNLVSIQGKYRGYSLSPHCFESFKINDDDARREGYKSFTWAVENRANTDWLFVDAAGYRIPKTMAGNPKKMFSAYPLIIGDKCSFGDNLGPFPTTEHAPNGKGGSVIVIQNFAQALEYMVDIQPVPIPKNFTNTAAIFKFRVSCGIKDGIILISPQYFSNTGTRDSYDFYNGYGGRSFINPTAGCYFNGEYVWLLLNKEDPQRYYGFIPVVDMKTDTTNDFIDYYANYTSVSTDDFKQYLDVSAVDIMSSAQRSTFIKRVEEEGFEQ